MFVFRRLHHAPAAQAAAAWLATRSLREQRLIAGLTILAGIAVLWYGVAQPILRAREAATARIETAAQLNVRLDSVTPGQTASAGNPVAGEMADVLRQRAVALGLSPDRIEAEAEGAGIVIEGARYDSIVRLIAAVESVDGGVVQDLRIDRGNAPGLVRLQMRVRR